MEFFTVVIRGYSQIPVIVVEMLVLIARSGMQNFSSSVNMIIFMILMKNDSLE